MAVLARFRFADGSIGLRPIEPQLMTVLCQRSLSASQEPDWRNDPTYALKRRI